MERRFERISEKQWLEDTGIQYYEENITIPQRATTKSAGYDIYAPLFTVIPAHSTKLVPTGLKVSMEPDEVLLIFVRSSLGIKKNITLSNGTGVIDADYFNNTSNEGHLWLALKNDTDTDFEVSQGDRLCQGVFVKFLTTTDDEPLSESRNGGIGSTDKS